MKTGQLATRRYPYSISQQIIANLNNQKALGEIILALADTDQLRKLISCTIVLLQKTQPETLIIAIRHLQKFPKH